MSLQKAIRFRKTATPFLANVVGDVPWVGWSGPDVWATHGKPNVPAIMLHLDTRQVPASKLCKNTNILHDIETALGGQVVVSWKNHFGLGLLFDERPKTSNALDAMIGQCCFMVGRRQSGKTTLLQHLVRRFDGEVVVLDPKPYEPGKWASKVRAVGQNGDYEAIAGELDRSMAEMHNRTRDSKPKLIIIDELYRIAQFLPEYPAKAMQILAFGAEGNMDVIVATQTDRLAANGLTGLGDLRAGFIQVRTCRQNDNFFVIVGGTRYAHPGKFETPSGVGLTQLDRYLVRYALRVEPKGSFALSSKMYGIVQYVPYWTEHRVREKASEWEAAGLLTSEGRNEKGHPTPRMVTKRLYDLHRREA